MNKLLMTLAVLLLVITSYDNGKMVESKEAKQTNKLGSVGTVDQLAKIVKTDESTKLINRETNKNDESKSVSTNNIHSKVKKLSNIDTDESDFEYYELTAYTNGVESTGKRPGDKDYGITASGERTKEGVTIAADWSKLPKGTVVWIEGVGERTVQDKGGAIKGNRIDVFFEDLDEAKEFGRKKNVKVKIISMPIES